LEWAKIAIISNIWIHLSRDSGYVSVPSFGRMRTLADYRIVPDSALGYGIEINAPDRFLYIRGFSTESDARVWIVETANCRRSHC
jgi:hypothetical protein